MHQATCCLCSLLLAGPILLIVGLAFLGSARTDHRGNAIDEFNAKTADWNPKYYEEFKALGDSITFEFSTPFECLTQPTNSPLLLNATADTTDTLKDARDVARPLAPQYKFVDGAEFSFSGGGKAQAATKCTSGKYQHGIPMQYSLSSSNHTLTAAGANLPFNKFNVYQCDSRTGKLKLKDAPVATAAAAAPAAPASAGPKKHRKLQAAGDSQTQDNVRRCQATCQDRFFGTFNQHYGTCDRKLYLKELCWKVKRTGSGGWQVDKAFPLPGAGCFYNSDGNGGDPTFDFARYDSQPHGDVQVTVRSSHDPWLQYLAVTHGTGGFGLSKTDKVKIGMALIIIGGLLCFCWVQCCYFLCGMRGKNRPQQRPANPVAAYYYDATARYGGKYGYGGGTYGAGPPGTAAGFPVANAGYPGAAARGFYDPPGASFQPPPAQGYAPPAQGYPAAAKPSAPPAYPPPSYK